jgi:hypothetical protein
MRRSGRQREQRATEGEAWEATHPDVDAEEGWAYGERYMDRQGFRYLNDA